MGHRVSISLKVGLTILNIQQLSFFGLTANRRRRVLCLRVQLRVNKCDIIVINFDQLSS